MRWHEIPSAIPATEPRRGHPELNYPINMSIPIAAECRLEYRPQHSVTAHLIVKQDHDAPDNSTVRPDSFARYWKGNAVFIAKTEFEEWRNVKLTVGRFGIDAFRKMATNMDEGAIS